jgi:predicted PurR-regulated permease PerM
VSTQRPEAEPTPAAAAAATDAAASPAALSSPAAAAPARPPDTSDRRFFVRAGGLALIIGLTYLVFLIIQPLWRPLVWAALLGAILAPLNARLAARLGNRPRLASAITTVLTVLLFVLPVAVIAGTVVSQAAQLLRRLDSFRPAGADGNLEVTDFPWLERPLRWIGEHTSLTLDELQTWIVEGAKHVLQGLMSSGGSVVLGALGTIISFALMLFVLFFVLRDGARFATQVVALLPIESQRRRRLWAHLQDVTRAVFIGIGFTALVQGILLGVGFWIAGLPSPLVFGVFGVLFALIPFVGTTIIWVPGAIWLFTQSDYGHGTFLALWGALVVSSVDNFLRPFLISGRVEVPTVAVFIGVIGGLAAFGFVGLFIGPIVLGLLVALFRFETEARRAQQASPPPAA